MSNMSAMNEADKECCRVTGDVLQIFMEGIKYTTAGMRGGILKLDSRSTRYHTMTREYNQLYAEGVEWVISTRVTVETTIRSVNKEVNDA